MPSRSEEEAFRELNTEMISKEPILRRALDVLGEQYDGVVILVHRFDPVCQVSVSRAVTQGDPLAARQSARKFLTELEFQDQLQFQMRFQQRPPPSNEDNNPG